MNAEPLFAMLKHRFILVLFASVFVVSALPGLVRPAHADTYSIPYPVCDVNAVELTTTPGGGAGGQIAITFGGGDAYSTGCPGYSGTVGLAIAGGSSGGLVAVTLGGGSATASPGGVAIAPLGFAQGGVVNIGCTVNPATGVTSQWCPTFNLIAGLFHNTVLPVDLGKHNPEDECDVIAHYTALDALITMYRCRDFFTGDTYLLPVIEFF